MKFTYFTPLVVAFIACSSPKVHITSPYENKPVMESPEEVNLSPSMIDDAGDLADEFPDESLVYDKIKVVVNFKFNEKYDSTQYYKQYLAENKKADSLARIAKKKTTNSKVPELTEHPIPDGEVLMNTDYEVDYTSIKDFLDEPIVFHYNSMVSIKNIHFKIDNTSATLEKEDKSFDGQTYFKTDSRYKLYKLSLPVRGSQVNYEYTESCRDAKFNSTLYIPEEHFAQKKVIKIALPKYLNFEIIEKNFKGLNYTKDTVEEYPSFGATTEKTKYLVYTFKRLKPFQDYILNRGPSYDYPMLYFQFKSATMNGKTHNILRNTDDLYEWYKLVSSNLTNDTSAFATFTKNLVKNKKTDEEKIKTVFYWIQDNIRYIAFEDGIAGFRPDECADVFRKRYGDCKGMANLTKNMLQVLGYDARLTWIGTKHQNYSYDQPGMPVDNHAICAVKLNGKYVFLDGTENFIPMYDYANRIQGRRCIVENGKSYSIETIPEWGYEHNEEASTETIEIKDKLLLAKIKKTYKGESKLNLIREYNYLEAADKDEIISEYLTGGNINFKLSNLIKSDLTNRDIDPVMSYDLSVKDHVIKSGTKTFVNIEWDREYANFEIDTNRTVDLDLGHKNYINRKVTFKLANGQKVLKLPKPVSIENEYYIFKLEMKQVGNTIVYSKTIINKKDYLPASMIKTLNADCKLLTEFYNTYIELN